MKNIRFFLLALTVLAISLWQCNSNNNAPSAVKSTDSVAATAKATDDLQSSFNVAEKGIPVFYNMYLSVDMSKLFKVEGSVFNSSYLNPVSNTTSYINSGKQALNLGVYAVDLSYIRVYEQLEKSKAYFDAMRKISGQLGIPDDFVLKMSDRFEKNINQKDSLMKLADIIYKTTDAYLVKNDRGSSSLLIILGGWTEALYLSSKIAQEVNSNTEILSKIADQKSSITDLLQVLQVNKSDKEIADFLPALEALKTSFDKFNFDEKNPSASSKQFQELVSKINHLRSRLVS